MPDTNKKQVPYFIKIIGIIINKLKVFFINAFKLNLTAAKKFYDDHGFSDASSLSYVTIFSFVPVFILIFAIYSSLDSTQEIFKNTIEDIIYHYFFPDEKFEKTLVDIIKGFSTNITAVSILGVAFIIIAAVDIVIILEKAINSTWNIKKGRSFLQNFMIYWMMLTLAPIFLVLSFYVTSKYGQIFLFGVHFSNLIFPLFVTWFGFFLAFLLIPRTKVNFKSAAIGAFVAGFLWEIGKLGFTLYLTQIGNQTLGKIYGPLYVIPISIAWIYLSYSFLLYGSQISYLSQYPEIYRLDQYKNVDYENFQLFYILNTLFLISENYNGGHGATSLKYLADKNNLSRLLMSPIIESLVSKGFLREFQMGSKKLYLPEIPMDKIYISDILSLVKNRKQLYLSIADQNFKDGFYYLINKLHEIEKKELSDLHCNNIFEIKGFK